MKYVALTFDDGRGDNYSIAYPILKKYGMTATLFATTGFIDGTWHPDSSWDHAGPPMTVKQLLELSEQGWEIGLHGDRHVTELTDWQQAMRKLASIGIDTGYIGCSLPNSRFNESDLQRILNSFGNDRICYIRRGRANNVRTPLNGFLFSLYSLTGNPAAYLRFNRPNILPLKKANAVSLPSVVIRHGDDPENVLKLLDSMDDDSLCILMLHSILPPDDPNYGKDVWNWDAGSLDRLCAGIKELESRNRCRHGTLKQLVTQTIG